MSTSTAPRQDAGYDDPFRLGKSLGVMAIAASALTHEYELHQVATGLPLE